MHPIFEGRKAASLKLIHRARFKERDRLAPANSGLERLQCGYDAGNGAGGTVTIGAAQPLELRLADNDMSLKSVVERADEDLLPASVQQLIVRSTRIMR